MNKERKFEMKMKVNSLAWSLVPVLIICLLLSPVRLVTAAGPISTTVEITSIAPSPAYIGQPVEINIRVASANPQDGIPTGRVEIRSGQNRVCALTLDAAGEGVCILSFDTPASVSLKAIYLGKDAFLPALSTDNNLIVKNKHTPVIEILSHLPNPSTIAQPVDVAIRLTSAGPVPTGTAAVWRSSASCTAPPASSTAEHCSINLSSGAGSCSLALTTPGDGTLCAAYGGDSASFPAQADPQLHFVSDSNTFTLITKIDPEPSVIGETVWVSFEVGSPDGQPAPTDWVKVTSGALSCTAAVADGRCPLTFATPHLHDVIAAYQGGASLASGISKNAASLQPSTSRVFVHRVNAPPTNIALSSDQVNVFTTTGNEIGVLTAQDPNTDETHRFSLVPGTGSEHNSLFRISGNSLVLNRAIPQDQSRVTLRIRAADPAGLIFEKAFSLTVMSEAVLPATGFAAGHITRVLPQPPEKSYQKFDSVILEIPALDLQAEITGVPNSGDGWDTTWLWNQVGWLNGTAFPGWSGNSVLAAHNVLPSGNPGPFAQLHKLRWGDQIRVQAYGETSVYEVRSVETVDPHQSSVLDHQPSPWLTLVTCKSFDENSGSYRLRVVVRAVWVSVQ